MYKQELQGEVEPVGLSVVACEQRRNLNGGCEHSLCALVVLPPTFATQPNDH